ncbi:uncharacterized protein N7483_012961 [Penicillium malachiteum]|uniref:uncharacterized protein n=1 Tax=Penicillium malachiteum TaxID=1324776 RepID=UPI002546F906|nr:uncharacterized protein N7483_012961 [Penicillium malachiteum]KAJ5715780.1 hypothetical protein N7483_012961 [Penicillium malachiteum]
MNPTRNIRVRSSTPNTKQTNPKSSVLPNLNKIQNMDKSQTAFLPYVKSEFNPGKINQVPNMTNEQNLGMRLINKDVELSPQSRAQTEKIFSQQFTNLRYLSQELLNNRSSEEGANLATIHKTNIETPLKDLHHSQLLANTYFAKGEYEDGKRYKLMQNIISAMRDFGDNNLGTNDKANAKIQRDIATVEKLQDHLFQAWRTTVNGQKNQATAALNSQTAILTEHAQIHRGRLFQKT